MLLENSYACTLYVVGPSLGHTRVRLITFDHENVIIYFVWGIDCWEMVTYLGCMEHGFRRFTLCTRIRTMIIDRSEVSEMLAKAIAYKLVGYDEDAAVWARKLIEALGLAEILK